MKESGKKFNRHTITSALPYANGPIHIGHLAGVYIPADIYARYLRSIGEDVLFIGGSDEHGVPISIKARKEGVSPQQIVDRYHEQIKKSFKDLGITFDVYSRTSAPIHHQTAADFFTKLYEQGEFTSRESEQFYDAEAEQFLADRYIVGTCPVCNYEEAYGDQCEQCGTSHAATDLINPKSTLSGNPPVRKKTRHWFLPLDKYEPWLKEWIVEGHRNDWKVNVYGQCKSWIDAGLKPRAITRDLDWGVKVPLEEAKGKVLYVWFDAPIGYISASKEWAEKTGKDWKPYWKEEDSKLVHFIGKDNIVFHCIIFPSMLKAEGSYIVPENVPANEYLNLEGKKISTSKNWAVWLHEYLLDFPGQQDVLRYVLTANAPETKDNDFTWADFQARNNNELLAVFGNFVNRTLVLTRKYYDGRIPEAGFSNSDYAEIIRKIESFPSIISSSIEKYRFREALNELMNLARLGNKFLTDSEPWKLQKTEPEKVKEILNLSLQICANLALLSEPFLPFTSKRLKTMLQLNKELKWENAGSVSLLSAQQELGEISLLFQKIEDEQIEHQKHKLESAKEDNEQDLSVADPIKPNIEFDDFGKMDLRTATILEAEAVPKTKKLLKLKLDTGVDQRTVVSGIAEYYKAEDIVGRKVVLLANLAPKKLRGIESNGMILMAANSKGELCFVEPSDEYDINNGSAVK